MSGQVRVLLFHATDDAEGIEQAYHRVSKELAAVPGQLGNELLRDVYDPTGFVVISRWRDLAAFQEWETGAEHKDSTSPLRQYRDTRGGRPFGIYQVAADY